MSDEQQHEGGRKPQTSHASKSHAPKSGHVADIEEFLAENGLAHCRETIPYKEAMRLAPDEGRFPSASGYGLIAKELSDAFNA